MNECKDCKWWEQYGDEGPVGWGECWKPFSSESVQVEFDNDRRIYQASSMDTKPTFGCNEWKVKLDTKKTEPKEPQLDTFQYTEFKEK